MIVSKLEYDLDRDNHIKVDTLIGDRNYTFFCQKDEKAKMDNMIIAIQRLVGRLSFKYSGMTDETVLMYAMINILSSRNVDEIIEKTEPRPKKKEDIVGLFPKSDVSLKEVEERMNREFIEILKDILQYI